MPQLAHVLFGSLLLTVKDEDQGRFKEMWSTLDSDLGQAYVALTELKHAPSHTYTAALSSGPIHGKGELIFSAAFEALPPDEAAMRAAYAATGRTVPLAVGAG